MLLPEEIDAREAKLRAQIEKLDAGEIAEIRSWFRDNREPLIVFGIFCLTIGFLAGYFVMKFLEHR